MNKNVIRTLAVLSLTLIVSVSLATGCSNETEKKATSSTVKTASTPTTVPTVAPTVKPTEVPVTATKLIANEKGEFIVEFEDFVIGKDGSVVNNAEMSKGKGLLAETTKFTASKKVILDKGKYLFTIYENAPNGENDALHIAVDKLKDVRTFPDLPDGTLKPAKNPPTFELTESGEHTLEVFTSNEAKMVLDRVVIAPVK